MRRMAGPLVIVMSTRPHASNRWEELSRHRYVVTEFIESDLKHGSEE